MAEGDGVLLIVMAKASNSCCGWYGERAGLAELAETGYSCAVSSRQAQSARKLTDRAIGRVRFNPVVSLGSWVRGGKIGMLAIPGEKALGRRKAGDVAKEALKTASTDGLFSVTKGWNVLD